MTPSAARCALEPLPRGSPRHAHPGLTPAATRRLFVYYLGVVKALKAAGYQKDAYLIASSGGASACLSYRSLALQRSPRNAGLASRGVHTRTAVMSARRYTQPARIF